MLEDLIIETEPIDTSNLSEQDKVVIDYLEETQMIIFDLTGNYIFFIDKDYRWRNWWNLKNDTFCYSYTKIYQILEEKYEYKKQQINVLIKQVLLKYYKINITTFNNNKNNESSRTRKN